MSKPIKNMMSEEYLRRYSGLTGACLVSVIGLDAVSTNKLRGELRAKELRLQTVKNSLARRALTGTVVAPLMEALKGPCSVVTGESSAIEIAKILLALKKTYPKMELKVGMLDGDPDLIDIERLATMKGRTELQGEVAMLIRSPGGRLAGCLAGPAGRIAGCVKAIVEKAEKAGGTEPTAN